LENKRYDIIVTKHNDIRIRKYFSDHFKNLDRLETQESISNIYDSFLSDADIIVVEVNMLERVIRRCIKESYDLNFDDSYDGNTSISLYFVYKIIIKELENIKKADY